MLKIIRPKETSQIAVVTGSKRNKWGCEISRHFRNKRGNTCKKIDELVTNSKNKTIRNLYTRINYFKKGYQLRSNLAKNENGDLLADSHII
jgi:hypothetical protein